MSITTKMAFRPLTASYANVVNLPASTADISIRSKPIERLLAKREKGHNSTINAVKLACEKYSTEMEEEIKKESIRFTENFERISNETQNELAVITVSEDDILNLNLDLFERVISRVEDCNRRRLKTADDFYETLKNLERKRSKHFKTVLNDGYRKTSKISHLLPYELLSFFDNEIERLNELTMNNYYYYAKLHSEFKLQAQEELRVALLKIYEVRDKFKMAVKVAKIQEVIDTHRQENYEPSLPVVEIANVSSFVGNVPRSPSDLEAWTQGLKFTLEGLDASAKKLLSLYKMAVVHVFNRFFSELNTITEALTEDDGRKPVQLEKQDMYQSAIEDITEIYTFNVGKLKDLWNSITEYMESNINKTNLFLNGSAHLWDDHFKRIYDIRKLIVTDLNFVIDKNNKAADKFDKKINTNLDKLRQESTAPKLDLYLKNVYKFLDSLEDLYQNQCDAEIKVLEKYYFLVDQEIDLLISEIDRFLAEHSNSDIREQKSCVIQHVEDDEQYKEKTPSEDKLIPHQMKVCQFEVEAVNNWMFGLWEAIRCYILTCRKEITEEADVRIKNITAKIQKRLKVRMATLKPRYHRVKTMIHDVRLKEIQDHNNDYDRTSDKVNRLITESSNFNKISQEDRINIFDDFEDQMRAIEVKLTRAVKSQQVGVCIEMYKKLSQEVNQSLVKSFADNYELLENNLEKINKTIWKFIESIKLFPDGGNYSRDEAKVYRKKIVKLKKQAPKRYKKVLDEFNRLKPQIMAHLDQTDTAVLKRMSQFKEEFEHNENICKKINDLKLKIRNSAYDIKFKIHRVDDDIDYYEDMSKTDISKRKQFDIMKDAVDDCLRKIIILTKFLSGDGKDDSYLFELNQMIDNSYYEIGKITDVFYKNHGVIINKEKVQSSYDAFMEEAKKNYNGFRVQVEIHCLECVDNLIKHILKLMKVNDAIFENLIRKFPDIIRSSGSGDEQKDELSEKLSQMSTEIEDNRKILEERKPTKEEIILKNRDRVNVLQSIILQLLEHVNKKVTEMGKVVQQEEEGAEEEENDADFVY